MRAYRRFRKYARRKPAKRNAGRLTYKLGSGRYRKPKSRAFRPGYSRTGGYYGRFKNKLEPELKFFDVNINETLVAVTAEFTQLLLIPQGTTESTRIGRNCIVKSIELRLNMNMIGAADPLTASDTIRIILYLDKQTNGGAATALQILETDNYLAFPNLSNSKRFTLLWDKTVHIRATAGSGNGTANDVFSNEFQLQYRKNLNLPIEYNNTAGALTEMSTNNLALMYISRRNRTAIDGRCRIRFTG